MYSLLSLLVGALTAVMIYLNGVLANHIGNYTASTFIHLTGLLFISALLLLTRSRIPFKRSLSLVYSAGGILGFLTVIFANIGVMYVGVPVALALGLLGQTVSAIMIDSFGWLGAPVVPFHWKKLRSLILIGSGIAVMAWIG